MKGGAGCPMGIVTVVPWARTTGRVKEREAFRGGQAAAEGFRLRRRIRRAFRRPCCSRITALRLLIWPSFI
jgi:hypothetical protein